MRTKKLMIYFILILMCISLFTPTKVFSNNAEQGYEGILVSNYSQSKFSPQEYPISNEDLNINVSESNLIANVQTLQDFDTRYVFSENCSMSAEWLYNKFSEYNLWTEYDYFEYENHRLKNIVATLNGTSDNIYILSAHYDSINSKDEIKSTDDPNISAPGADDDASGVAAVLESARIMSNYGFNATIKFVLFSAEEQGLIGSRHYAEKMKSNNEKIICDIQLDMIGYGNSSIDVVTNHESEWMAETMENVSFDYGIGLSVNRVVNPDFKYSDHGSFWDNGYSAVCLIENATPWNSNPYFHSKNDTIDKLNFTLIRKTTQLCIATLSKFANVSPLESVNKYALLVGSSGGNLDYTDDDVYDMCDVLINNCYFATENIKVLIDANATKENIKNNITAFVSKAKKDDTVIFFFSGHGYNHHISVYGSAISDDELNLWFNDTKSNLVIIIDSCHSGYMVENIKSASDYNYETKNCSNMDGVKSVSSSSNITEGFSKGLGQSGRIVLAACDKEQFSYEENELSNGVFTYYLTEGLKSELADTNGNGWISVEEAFYYAKPKTDEYNSSANSGEGQDPQIYDGIEGEFDLSSYGDLIISNAKVYSNINRTLNKNLTITCNGSLTLNNVILMMNCSFNGEYHIEVQSGGQLYIYNSNITSANDYHYLFWVRNNSRFEMRDSELHGCGYEMTEGNYSRTGLWINTNNVKLCNNIFSGNYAGLCFYLSENNSIINSTILNNAQYDICLENSTVYLLNTTFNKTSVSMINSSITVSWYLSVNVLYQNNTPVKNADVVVCNVFMVEIFNGSTDENGQIKNMVVQECFWKTMDEGGFSINLIVYRTPYLITASKNGYYGSETAEMNQNMEITIYLEDTTPPDANAGNDREIDKNTTVYFDGSNSTDNSGVIINYTWTFVDGDVEVKLYGVSPNYTFYNSGVFVVTLNVTDGSGNWHTDMVNIWVKDRMPPNANAGEDQVVSHGITMHFDGSNSTDNVGVVNYTWTFFDNSGIVLYGINPEYVFLTLGTHIVTLTVKDEAGNSDTDTVNIIVKDVTKPVIEIISPGQVVHSRDCIVKCVVTDNVKVERVEVSSNGYTWSSCVRENTDEYTAVLILEKGGNTVYIRATDSSGNVNTTSITVFVKAPEKIFPVFTSNTMLLLIGMIFCIAATIILEHKPKKRKGL